MKKHQIILSKNLLREITRDDLDLLRTQKNLNKKSFFYQDDITPEDQMSWYEKCGFKKTKILESSVIMNF